jgi:hypothetical protein
MDFLDGVLGETGGSGASANTGASSSWDDGYLNEDMPASSSSAITIQSLLMGLEGGTISGGALAVDDDDSNNNGSMSGLPLVSANPWASDEPPTPLDPLISGGGAATTTRLSALYGFQIEDISERSSLSANPLIGIPVVVAPGGGRHGDRDVDLLVDLFPAASTAIAASEAMPTEGGYPSDDPVPILRGAVG